MDTTILAYTVYPEKFSVGMLYEKIGRDYVVTSICVYAETQPAVYIVKGKLKK